MKTKLMFTLLVLSVFGCQNDDSPVREVFVNQNLPFQTISQINNTTSYSNVYPTGGGVTITTQQEWIQFQTNMGHVADFFSSTVVDFNLEMVIVVFDETKTSGDFVIDITQITEMANQIEVEAFGSGGSATGAPCHPFHIIKLDLVNKPVTFMIN
jgi:hypothetical protein